MRDRIKQIMESMHMSQQVFAQYIDMSPASLSSIFNGRTKPTLNIVEAIKRKFPKINTDWLMFGSGDMYTSNDGQAVEQPHSEPVSNREQALDFGGDSAPTPQASLEDHRPSEPQHTVRPEIIREEVKYIDRPQRHVMEIRVYYDDLTFETFVPAKK